MIDIENIYKQNEDKFYYNITLLTYKSFDEQFKLLLFKRSLYAKYNRENKSLLNKTETDLTLITNFFMQYCLELPINMVVNPAVISEMIKQMEENEAIREFIYNFTTRTNILCEAYVHDTDKAVNWYDLVVNVLLSLNQLPSSLSALYQESNPNLNSSISLFDYDNKELSQMLIENRWLTYLLIIRLNPNLLIDNIINNEV